MAAADSEQERFDVVVIGGGIVGCMSAFSLHRSGLSVALVERAHIGGGTTSNSFAWINGTSKTADEAYHRLNALGQALYRDLAREFGEEHLGLNPTGMLMTARRSDPTNHAELLARAERLERFDYPCTWVGHSALQVLEPHIEFPQDTEALYAMGDPCLDAPRFAAFIAQQLRAGGARVLEHTAAQALVMTDEGRITGVLTSAGVLATQKVLLCVGPGTPEVLSELTGYDGFAARFPISRVPGLLVTSPSTAPARLLRHIMYVQGEDGFHVLPAPNGGIKIGADDTDGLVSDAPDAAAVRAAALTLLRRTQAMIPAFAGEACIEACHIGIGVRPYPQDGMSLAGAMPGADGLFVTATHSGVTLAPALGKLMAELISSGQTPAALEPFRIDRFQRVSR